MQAEWAASGAPAVSVALMEGGALTCAAAFGQRGAEDPTPVGPDTRFQLAGAGQWINALLLLRLVQDGLLDLDLPLTAAWPELRFARGPDWAEALTLRQLLNQTASLHEGIDLRRGAEDDDLQRFFDEVYLPGDYLMAEPGAFWSDSASNANLAGLLAERAGGAPYADLVATQVFAPLHMDHSSLRTAQAGDDIALGVGFSVVDGDFVFGPVSREAVPEAGHQRPAGGSTWTTPVDVLRGLRMLVAGDPSYLSDDLRQQVVSSQVTLPNSPGVAYGLGPFLQSGRALDGAWVPLAHWQRGGNSTAWSAEWLVVPDQGFGVVIQSSAYALRFDASIDAALQTLVELPPAEPLPEPAFIPARLDAHVGRYADPFLGGALQVFRVGDGLRVDAPDLAALGYVVDPDLVPISTNQWWMRVNGDGFALDFIADAPGAPSRWVANARVVWQRVDGGAR